MRLRERLSIVLRRGEPADGFGRQVDRKNIFRTKANLGRTKSQGLSRRLSSGKLRA